MNISRITYFNIGNSADEGQDFFDVLKPGFAIFYGEEEIALVKFHSLNKSYKLEIKPEDYEWWEDAAKHIMEVNKLDTSINFLAGLINDTVVGLPLGISSLSYILICIATSYLRNITIRPNPIKDWFYFLFIISLINSMNYSILTLFFSYDLLLLSYLVNIFFTFIGYDLCDFKKNSY